MSNISFETPNFIYLLQKKYPDLAFLHFLHRWEDLLFSFLIALLLSAIFLWGYKKNSDVPSGFSNFLEWTVEGLYKLFCEVLAGHGHKFFPFVATLFLYILSMNLLGLIPFLKTPSSNINVTVALAICVFCYVQFLNIKHKGVLGFLYYLAGSPKNLAGWLIVPIMFPLELLTQLARPLTLALRLAGNMFGDHLLIAVFATLGLVWLNSLDVTLTIPLQIPIIFLAILTGLMQALVFAILASVYILLAISEEH